MAYGDQTMSTRKAVSIAMVIVLHAVIGYAFVTGLAYNVVKKVARDLKTFDVEEEAPPPPDKPPPPPPETKIEPPPVIAPPPIVQVAPTVAPPIVSVPTPPPPVIHETAPPAPPPPAVSRPGKPRGNPSEWVTTEDYPSADLRAENQGVSAAELTVGADGKASNCKITSSSGFPGLDAKTCQMLLRRSRFTPQLDGNGQPMPFTYRQRVRWQIPKD
ncbi:energy transducer TonB [Rhizorhabdus dicambivorans]|uniref:Energy transducer TonB n=1 Tax=Rhizorhabdus dicambivorans TaxID=1850238 RepID=A0A2A4G0I2_9SPHN|nr:energy transducer TonB [Rhizorhabdus dicambivorans]ATE64962.1 energy transducer TonB [Rhizorhabdus dicambivorans]PCE44235.1 energy transducer TonB [Rhizorhabdus dicambivorans]